MGCKLTISSQQKLNSILREMARRHKAAKLKRHYESFYEWQQKFCSNTKEFYESCLCAANQIGKTRVGTTIDAYHLTGEYPEDYPGYKFDHAPIIWCLGYSMEKTRDLLQNELFGTYSNQTGFEGGLITKDKIISQESAGGTVNAMRTVRVKHKLGTAMVQFWSYTQGQHAIMGDVVDWVHVDEEPRDQSIRPQLLTRTINGDKGRGGRIIYTFTPENGRTELVIQFSDTPTKHQSYMQIGWNDAPHMTDEKKERLLAQYPAHQRKMRSEGEPMLGHGRIYDISDDFIECEPFEIPDFWDVIVGMDFGYDHPQAFVKLAFDPDNDIIYVTNSWKASIKSANQAWGAVQDWAKGIPVAWPSDGLQHEKGRDVNLQQKEHYIKAGFKMIHEHATWATGGTSVESGIRYIQDKQSNGTYKVFKGQADFMQEHRQYHRAPPKDGIGASKIVKTLDDMLDAGRYAIMMRRYAKKQGDIFKPIDKSYRPMPIPTIGKVA
jgi:phage terminase large subunit-like protein